MWQVACREEEVAAPGDFVEYTIGEQSILVVRAADGQVVAHHNACLHRGTRLAEGAGTFPDGTIRCRYHAWTYGLGGALLHVVDEHEFEHLPPELCLAKVRVECWGGFVFVNLDANAEPLVDYLQPLPSLLDAYHLDQMRFRAYQSTVLPANWKAAVDAFNEAYHVQGTHPQILPWTDDVSIAYEQLGIHAHYGRLPEARRQLRPSPRLGLTTDDYDEGEILAGLVAGLGRLFLKDEMAIVDEFAGAADDRGPQPARRVPGAAARAARGSGLDVSGLTLDQMTSADDVFVFPNIVGPIYPGRRSCSASARTGSTPTRASRTRGRSNGPAPTNRSRSGSGASIPSGATRTGARSRTRTTPTCSRCRRA